MRRALAANCAAYGANGVALLVTARALGASGRGSYAALLAWASLVSSTVNLSLGPALAHAASHGYKRAALLRRFLLDLVLLSPLGCIAMLVLVTGPLSHLVEGWWTAALAVGVVPSLIACDWLTYLLQGFGATSAYSLTRFLPSALNLVLLLGVAVGHRLTLTAAVGCFWLANQIAASLVTAWLLRREKRAASDEHGGSPQWKDLWRFGARAHVGALASVLNARLDLLIVSLVLSPVETGQYSVAVSLTAPIAVVGSSIGAVRFAEIARASSVNVDAVVRRAWREMLGLTVVASVVVGVGAAFFIGPVFGTAFSGGRGPALLLAAGTGGLGATHLATAMLQARGRPAVASCWYVVAAIASALTLGAFVPVLGLTGAALSSMLTYLAVGSAMGRATLRRRGSREPTCTNRA